MERTAQRKWRFGLKAEWYLRRPVVVLSSSLGRLVLRYPGAVQGPTPAGILEARLVILLLLSAKGEESAARRRFRLDGTWHERVTLRLLGVLGDIAKHALAQRPVLLFLALPCSTWEVEVPRLGVFGACFFLVQWTTFAIFHRHQSTIASPLRLRSRAGRPLQPIDLPSAGMTDALEPSDEHLVSLSKDGSLDAFNSLVERYQAAVYNLCLRLIGDRAAAEDATQEAFISAYRSISRFEGGNLRSWLLRIAANQSKDELRRRLRRGPHDSLSVNTGPDDAPIDLPDPSETAGDYIERMAVGHGIQQALLQLPFEQRQAVLLSDLHGYHYEEIARIAGSSIGTVKSRIHRGRERLRGILSEQPELFGLRHRLEE